MDIRLPLFFMVAVLILTLPFNHAAGNEIREIFQKVNPAVVEIKTLSIENLSVSLEKDEFVEHGGLGSGVLISEDGKILTAAHVVQAADKIVVEFLDGQQIRAKVVSSAPWADVALLELEEIPRVNKPVPLGDSDTVQVGDKVFVIGVPYGLSHTLTVGYISSRHMAPSPTGSLSKVEVFQTDAAINRGNSGGPLFTMNGEVIGIVSHIKSQSGGFEGIGFAITSNVAKELTSGVGFWSGVEGVILSDRLAEILNLPQPAGLLVQKISENSPAAKMGLKPSSVPIKVGNRELLAGGDIILGISDIEISNNQQMYDILQSYFSQLRRGDIYEVKVLRGGEIITLMGRKE